MGPGEPFDAEAVDELLDDARRWERVRDPGLLDPHELLERVVGGLFGARIDGAGYRLELRPTVPDGWRRFGLRRLRAHRTLIDLELRPRAEWITVRIRVTFGPSVAVELTLPEPWEVIRATVDEVALEGARALFTATAEHEVVLFTRGPSSR